MLPGFKHVITINRHISKSFLSMVFFVFLFGYVENIFSEFLDLSCLQLAMKVSVPAT